MDHFSSSVISFAADLLAELIRKVRRKKWLILSYIYRILSYIWMYIACRPGLLIRVFIRTMCPHPVHSATDVYPSKRKIFNQCRFDAGPPSTTLDQP